MTAAAVDPAFGDRASDLQEAQDSATRTRAFGDRAAHDKRAAARHARARTPAPICALRRCAAPRTPHRRRGGASAAATTTDTTTDAVTTVDGTIGVTTDVLFPIWQQRELRDLLEESPSDAPVEYEEIDAPFGHDTFLIERRRLGGMMEHFLND